MPYYQWRCESCDNEEEVKRTFEDCYLPPEGECPECGEEKWKKLLNVSINRYKFCDP